MPPKDIEEMMQAMNRTKIEFSIPDDSGDGDDEKPWTKMDGVISEN